MCICDLITSSYDDISHIALGTTFMTSLNLNFLFKASISKSHIVRHWDLGLQHLNLGRTQFSRKCQNIRDK